MSGFEFKLQEAVHHFSNRAPPTRRRSSQIQGHNHDETNISHLKDQVTSLEAQNSVLSANHAALQRNHHDLQNTNDALNHQHARAISDLEAVNNELRNVKHDNDYHEKKVAEVQRKLAAANNELNPLQSDYKALHERNARLTVDHQKLQDEHTALIHIGSTPPDTSPSHSTALANENIDLRTRLGTLKARYREDQATIQTLSDIIREANRLSCRGAAVDDDREEEL